ncbi:hypothetical protein PGT21_025776 [Puccinia graminis f. sp. tritici]|uniref:Uncharacterized protein n=1 Tax=Puccinia graminis f. sp. tritici TaxID=56615 RepID=A0A5B0P366_PUCGR|nr:hypothetical protein PGT21_025776 [Puccinia graminis f. sp. tritici]
MFYLGPARDDPIKGRVYSGCLLGAHWAGTVVGGPDSWRSVRSDSPQSLAYPEVQTNPSSYSICDPAAASASARISTSHPSLYRPAAAQFVNRFGSGC